MTLAAGTLAEKEDFEVIRFNSRSLEDLSKFDWSGGGSTHNQSEFCKVALWGFLNILILQYMALYCFGCLCMF